MHDEYSSKWKSPRSPGARGARGLSGGNGDQASGFRLQVGMEIGTSGAGRAVCPAATRFPKESGAKCYKTSTLDALAELELPNLTFCKIWGPYLLLLPPRKPARSVRRPRCAAGGGPPNVSLRSPAGAQTRKAPVTQEARRARRAEFFIFVCFRPARARAPW